MVSCRCAFNVKNKEREEYNKYSEIYILNRHKICKIIITFKQEVL